MDWGLPREEIEAVIGEKLPATGMTIRDWVAQKGLDFGSIKEALQAKRERMFEVDPIIRKGQELH